MSATWVTFFFEAGNFLLLAALLGWLFFRPVRDALERRRSEIEGERQAAARAREEALRVLEQARERRAELETSIEALRAKAQREAEAERERLLEAAREQARRERLAREEELTSLRRAEARARVRDAVFAAREIVVRLLEAVEGPELETALVASACRQLEALRVAGSLAPVLVSAVRPSEPVGLNALAQAAGVAPAQIT